MAYRIKVAQADTILTLHQQGWSLRWIARKLEDAKYNSLAVLLGGAKFGSFPVDALWRGEAWKLGLWLGDAGLQAGTAWRSMGRVF